MIIPVENIKSFKRLPINCFTGANSIRAMRYAEPYKWSDDFSEIKLEKDWQIAGWNYAKSLPWKQREIVQDMLIVMFESPDGEDMWSHFIETTDLIWAKNEREKIR